MTSVRTIAVLQARMSSKRLPGKVMLELNGKPMIYWQAKRIIEAKSVNQLVVATSIDSTDDLLVDYLEENSIDVYRGSLNNVLSRFNSVATDNPSTALIRLTADCPLVMPELIDEMVEKFYEQDVDYLSNTLKPTFPDGLDIEIMKPSALAKLAGFSLEEMELEHVTYGLYTRPHIFKVSNYLNSTDQSSERWTVDYQEDFDFIRSIFQEFLGREHEFLYRDVIELLARNHKLKNYMGRHRRNEDLHLGSNHG